MNYKSHAKWNRTYNCLAQYWFSYWHRFIGCNPGILIQNRVDISISFQVNCEVNDMVRRQVVDEVRNIIATQCIDNIYK